MYRWDNYVIIILTFTLLLSRLAHFLQQNLQKGKKFQRNEYWMCSGDNEAFLLDKRNAAKSIYVGGVEKK